MNERIKQLLNEATSGHEQEYDTLKWMTVSDKEMKKFAQLIVRECANFIDSHEQVDKYGFALDIVYGADLMKHFGVEE
jgi:myo-inositol catabolism protein IolC